MTEKNPTIRGFIKGIIPRGKPRMKNALCAYSPAASRGVVNPLLPSLARERKRRYFFSPLTRLAIKRLTVVGPLFIELADFYRTQKHALRKYLFYLRHRQKLKPNAELKNKFLGKRCFILACGPSIKTQDLKKLEGEFCISVSNFFVHPDFKIIKPEYHVFSESHAPITKEQMKAWLEDAERHLPEGQKVMMSVHDRSLSQEFKLLKKQRIYFYVFSQSQISAESPIEYTKQIPLIQTVAHQAIYLALYSGAKEIYLVGCDHDWILHYGENRHFYAENESELTRTGLNQWGTDLGTEFESYVRLWNIYKEIKRYATVREVLVMNATRGGLLDVFPRKNLDEVLNKK
ncbi:MAG: hypothetical protein A3C06_02915 [Candidatus Taylorbacteria bacterium RIFCSPHIGHO2_02_FULL_46_13]|uniref:6-hydroxymethylpterin diphosphokinase MptE-like domain-containing protein n=1 Tax=Candidatus Taylorbacteria bacterium RIFCSPHIGHO2_02_FULL_46_13 TaxID=1802312 RepID=A0A1G2MRL3_9BACT|nr:MAG: hypothetical protein A3C06_02915 [Candidatus Taylorbacteria bacterium RIFCSPHIGHO2_02_FULL_46_13]